VQRYLRRRSLRASRIGLLFNALVKVPMQFLILLLGVMIFSFLPIRKAAAVFQPNLPARVERGLRSAV